MPSLTGKKLLHLPFVRLKPAVMPEEAVSWRLGLPPVAAEMSALVSIVRDRKAVKPRGKSRE